MKTIKEFITEAKGFTKMSAQSFIEGVERGTFMSIERQMGSTLPADVFDFQKTINEQDQVIFLSFGAKNNNDIFINFTIRQDGSKYVVDVKTTRSIAKGIRSLKGKSEAKNAYSVRGIRGLMGSMGEWIITVIEEEFVPATGLAESTKEFIEEKRAPKSKMKTGSIIKKGKHKGKFLIINKLQNSGSEPSFSVSIMASKTSSVVDAQANLTLSELAQMF